ncbi:hypothetical protein [Deinococcus sp. QL22]|uniref:hypothetical protein n=1 Tax=Deinococcus sp. QL22 TaxID=2939437 RepID=UPI002017D82C|nr:hypothetical protein [Deinococcus sp. QL22]UQN10296.1 hypothetical protein M1R55_29535 [Deinococcus sp. QL22]UQN10430.1 hypothetical protein M1R55_28860 [Deinococcus sp. QL22]
MIWPLRFRQPAPAPDPHQKNPAVALALFNAWKVLHDDPDTLGTPAEEEAFRQLTLYDVAHLTGSLSRPRPITRPEARP